VWHSDGSSLDPKDSSSTPRADILRYICLVRVKTSITLPSELISQLDRVDKNRSALLERAARAYLARLESDERDRRDLEIINRNAERLNREAMDTLEYQQLP
jgi:metal-responsive CopG/Arc/MetJ family transcriptional regulator